MEITGEIMCLIGMITSAVFSWNYLRGRHKYKMKTLLYWFSMFMLCVGYALLILAER